MSFLHRIFRIARDRPRQPESGAASRLDLALALEPRIMLDGAAAVTTAEAADGAAEQAVEAADAAAAEAEAKAKEDAEALARAAETVPAAAGEPGDEEAAPEAPPPTERQVVFVDHRVKDPEVLLQDLDGDLKIVMLDGDSDGLSQIAAALDGLTELDAVHIIAEGSDGEIYLGDARVTTESLEQYAEALGQIGAALSVGGDILFYGCNLGETARGLAFIDQVAELTGADIAASDDRTASTALGGDVELEIRTGSVEASALLTTAGMAGYQHSLATITVTSTSDSGAGTLRQAITDASAGDTITFAAGLAGQTITLTSGELTINKQLTIDGDLNDDLAFTAANDITISGGNSSRVFNVTGGASGTEVVLFGLRIRNGLVSGDGGAGSGGATGGAGGAGEGGAIRNSGHLIINRSVIDRNHASGGGGGAGTYAGASTFRGYGGGGGGGYGGSGGGDGGTSGFNDNAATTGSGGNGGRAGFSNNANAVNYAGKGGSSSGGAATPDNFAAGGGAGGTAVINSTNVIGGGGGGYTPNTGSGGAGGLAVGGIFNAGTLTINNTSMTRNAGAGGGGGGGFNNGQTSGAGGNGIGAIYNANGSTFRYDSTLTFGSGATANAGAGGTDGSNTGAPAATAGGNGSPTANVLNNAGATTNSSFSLNAAPTTTNLNGDSFTFTEGNSATPIDQGSDATVADSDSLNFDGGNLTVTIAAGEDAAEDVLSFDTSGTVSLAATTAGSNVSVGGTVVGTLGNAIAAGNDLVVNLNASSTPANVQTLVRAITYQNTDTNNPTTGDRTVRVTINDGDGGTSSNADVTVTVAGENDAPTTTNLNGDSFTFTEGNSATEIDQGGDATVADVDSTNFSGGNVTVTIAAGEDAAEDVLSLDTSGAVTLAGTTAGSNVSVGGTVVGTLGNAIAVGNDLVVNLNSNATPANVQTLVRAITYQNTDTNNPTAGDRTVRVTINDGDGGTSSNADVTVTVAGENDAPTTTNLNGDSFTFTEGNSATTIDQGGDATVADVDSTNFSGGNLTVTIAAGEDAAEDVLSLDTSGTVALAGTTAGSNVSVGGTVVGTLGNAIAAGNDLVVNLNASSTPTNVQALVRAITYQNTDTNNPTTGDRTVRVTINDGDGGTSSNADVTVMVAGENDAPTTTNLNGDSFTFTEGNSATTIDQGGNATVADVDSTNFSGGNVTVTIASGEDAAEDVLSLDTSGTVALAGTAAGSNVSVGGTVVGTLGNAIAAGNDLVVNLNASSTSTNVQTLVRAITYQNTDTTNPTTGDRTVRVTINDGDGGTSTAADMTVTVAAQNDAPSFTAGATLAAVDEDTTAPSGATISSLLSGNFSDVDGNSLAGIVVTADASTSGTDGDWQYSTDNGSNWFDIGTVSTSLGLLLGATANDRLRFVPASNYNGTPGSLAVFAVDDSSATTFTSGGTRQTFDTTADGSTSTVSAAGVSVGTSITAVNDAPTTTNLNGDSFTFTEGDSATTIDQGGNATVDDVDSTNFNGGNLTVTIAAGEDAAEDVLSLDTSGTVALAGTTAGSNVSVGGTVIGTLGNAIAAGNDLVVNLNGSSTPANVQTLVRAITYQNTDTTNLTAGDRTVRVTINDGDGGTSTNADVTVTVAGVNDAPTTTNLNGDSITFSEGDSATTIDQGGDAVVADVDSADFDGGTLTVTIAAGEDAAEDVLSFDTSGTVALAGTTAGANVSVGGTVVGTLANAIAAGNDLVVNLNASSTPANLQTLVRAITYQNTDTDNPTAGDRTVRVTVSDGDGGTSANADVTVTVAGVNDAPSFTAGVTMAAIDEDTTAPGGATIASLLSGNFSDPAEGDSFAGIVVTADDASGVTEGAWQYSTDGGSTWFDIGTVSTSSGLLLGAGANDRLRFLPAEDYNGTPGGLTVFAVDDSATTTFTSGASRQSFDTTADDAASAVSAAGVAVTISVTPVAETGLTVDQTTPTNTGGNRPATPPGGSPGGTGPGDTGPGGPGAGGPVSPVSDGSRQSVDAVRGNVPRGEAPAVTAVQDAVNDSQNEAAGQAGGGRSTQTLNTVNDATSDARSQASGTPALLGPARGPSTTTSDLATFLGGLAPAAGEEEEDDAPAPVAPPPITGEQAPPPDTDGTAPADVAPAAGPLPPQGGPASEGEGEATPEGDGAPDGGTPPPDQPAADQQSGIVLPDAHPVPAAAGLSVQMQAVLASFERERQALVDAVSAGS